MVVVLSVVYGTVVVVVDLLTLLLWLIITTKAKIYELLFSIFFLFLDLVDAFVIVDVVPSSSSAPPPLPPLLLLSLHEHVFFCNSSTRFNEGGSEQEYDQLNRTLTYRETLKDTGLHTTTTDFTLSLRIILKGIMLYL